MEFQLKTLISNWNILRTNVYGLYVGSGNLTQKFLGIPKGSQCQSYQISPQRWDNGFGSSNTSNEQDIQFQPAWPSHKDWSSHKTYIVKLSHPFKSLPCSKAMSKICAQAYGPRAYLTLKRFKVQPCKLRSNPVTSHHFHWCSTDLSPNPSTFDTTSPRRSASLHPPDLNSLIANLVAEEEKCCDGFVDAQGIGQGLEEMESRASSGWPVAKQTPKIIVSEGIPPTLKVKRLNWSQETIFS